jgi:hypothetical protein
MTHKISDKTCRHTSDHRNPSLYFMQLPPIMDSAGDKINLGEYQKFCTTPETKICSIGGETTYWKLTIIFP